MNRKTATMIRKFVELRGVDDGNVRAEYRRTKRVWNTLSPDERFRARKFMAKSLIQEVEDLSNSTVGQKRHGKV